MYWLKDIPGSLEYGANEYASRWICVFCVEVCMQYVCLKLMTVNEELVIQTAHIAIRETSRDRSVVATSCLMIQWYKTSTIQTLVWWCVLCPLHRLKCLNNKSAPHLVQKAGASWKVKNQEVTELSYLILHLLAMYIKYKISDVLVQISHSRGPFQKQINRAWKIYAYSVLRDSIWCTIIGCDWSLHRSI